MFKKTVIDTMNQYGDAIIDFHQNPHGEFVEPICCTTDFSNKYIKQVKREQRYPSLRGKVLVFDWTNYKFNIIDPLFIKRITPLSKVLNNGS